MNGRNFLSSWGLEEKDLRQEEQQVLDVALNELERSRPTVEKIRQRNNILKSQAIGELNSIKNNSQNFVTLLTFFIPIIGIIRKWYDDQHEVELKIKIKVYSALEEYFDRFDRKQEEINRGLEAIKKDKYGQ